MRQRGFTLIELLVVIAIIGLLASIILASLGTARSKGRDARRLSDIREIQNALELYVEACNSYPEPSPLALSDQNTPSVGVNCASSLGSFLPTLPLDPSNVSGGNNYLYAAFGGGTSCSSYHLGADLEVMQTVGSQTLTKPKSADCTNGSYNGNSSNGNGGVGSVGGSDFQFGSRSAGQWVYDVTP